MREDSNVPIQRDFFFIKNPAALDYIVIAAGHSSGILSSTC
jgi:hypothetical protein